MKAVLRRQNCYWLNAYACSQWQATWTIVCVLRLRSSLRKRAPQKVHTETRLNSYASAWRAHSSNASSFFNAGKSSSSPATSELSHLTKPVLKYAIISVNYNVTMITHSRSAHGPYRDRRLSLKSTAKLHKWPKHVVFRLLNKPAVKTKSKPIKIRKLFGNVKQSFEWHDYLLLALTLALIEPTRSFSNYLF